MDFRLPAVYQIEMRTFRQSHDRDLDRLFQGKAPVHGSSGVDPIAQFVRTGRNLYLTGVDPEVEAAHLTGLLELVNLTDKGDLAARPASNVIGPPSEASGLPKRRRRLMLESLFATLTAKIAAGGVAVAMAATGGLATTGNLPDTAQTAVSQALGNIGINIPLGETAAEAEEALRMAEEAAAEAANDALEEVDENTGEVTDATDQGDGDGGQPNENAAFGQSVAADAQGESDGMKGVDGQQISEQARARNEERKVAGQSNRPENAGPPVDAGSQAQTGLDRTADTPAAGYIPGNVGGGGQEQHKPAGTPGAGR